MCKKKYIYEATFKYLLDGSYTRDISIPANNKNEAETKIEGLSNLVESWSFRCVDK